MRIILGILLTVFLVGCAGRYQITLTNGNVITTKNRPRLNEDRTAYLFKNARGQRTSLPAFRIKEIEPL